MYFIIYELLVFPEICCKVLPSSCSKTTHYAQKYILNCFIVFLSCYSKILPANFRSALHFHLCKYRSCPLFKQRDMHSLDAHEARYAIFWL